MSSGIDLVDGSVHWSDLDSADSITSDSGDSNVALFSPGRSPGVSDDPEVFSGLAVSTVSYNSDGVIKSSSTSGVIEDSTLIESEVVISSSDGDSSWSNVKGGQEVIN